MGDLTDPVRQALELKESGKLAKLAEIKAGGEKKKKKKKRKGLL